MTESAKYEMLYLEAVQKIADMEDEVEPLQAKVTHQATVEEALCLEIAELKVALLEERLVSQRLRTRIAGAIADGSVGYLMDTGRNAVEVAEAEEGGG